MQLNSSYINYLSPAKLNLGLKITGKLSNGYHSLNTIFCLINLFDHISIQLTLEPKITLLAHDKPWHYSEDLAYKAACLLHKTSNQPKFGANIKVKKNIPDGSGLGGGSSNAATVLLALNDLWQLNLNNEHLAQLGLSLGADVPFFLYGRNAYATNVCEKLSPISIPKRYFVLVKPDFSIATKEIFSQVNKYSQPLDDDPHTLLNNMTNDLQSIAVGLYPELGSIINYLSQFGKTLMTGSGSAVFLPFADYGSAKKVALSIDSRYNTYLVHSLDKSPLSCGPV